MAAKHCSKCGALKPLSDYFKCSARPDGLKALCKACCQSQYAKYRAENRERVAQWGKDWAARYPERKKELFQKWYVAHAQSQRVKSRETYHANKDRARQLNKRWLEENAESRKAYKRTYRQDNKQMLYADNAAYRARRNQALPAWADLDAIRIVYEKAAEWGMEVDHIVPLRGKTVCGLHVPANLQLLKRLENIKKQHLIWPDMPTDPA